MFQFLPGVLKLAANFLGVSRSIAEMGLGYGPGAMTMPIRGRARWAPFYAGARAAAAGGGARPECLHHEPWQRHCFGEVPSPLRSRLAPARKL
jgi:hypothetical protein